VTQGPHDAAAAGHLDLVADADDLCCMTSSDDCGDQVPGPKTQSQRGGEHHPAEQDERQRLHQAGADPYLFTRQQDPEKARELMAQAGYPNGEGFGKLIINTWVSRAVPFLPESAQLAANYWKTELGIDAEVRVGDETALKEADNGDSLYGQMLWRDNEARVDGTSSLRSNYGTPDDPGRAHNDAEIFAMTKQALAVIDPVEQEVVLNTTYKRLRDEGHIQDGMLPKTALGRQPM
jgi:ABC-type transport system substrate-binding protein